LDFSSKSLISPQSFSIARHISVGLFFLLAFGSSGACAFGGGLPPGEYLFQWPRESGIKYNAAKGSL